jgi:hypothetical protein
LPLAGVLLLVCACTASIESDAADQLAECMIGNGGVEASAVRFSINGRSVEEVQLRYNGQGSSPYDAVYESCLAQVANDLDLVVD